VGQPYKTGNQLFEDIQNRQVPDNALGLWWLGQASFVVKGAGATVFIDPYLQPNPQRLVPPAFAPDQVTNADLVLCTHDHLDHVDYSALPGIAAASPKAKILVPFTARDHLIAAGVPAERVVVPPVDEEVRFGPATVTAMPAAHETLDYSPERGYPYLGYVLRLNGVTLYHSGDSTVYEGMSERLRRHRPDVALLPINGNDWKRRQSNIIGNMSYREAADLADEVDVDLTIPMHFGMFRSNTIPVGHFVDYLQDYYPGRKTHVMATCEGFVYLKP
jgi:L-ascorbate 6-phosphate lactonase